MCGITGILKWQKQVIWKANRTWAASMAAKLGCPSRRIAVQRSKASFGTKGDKNNPPTKSVLSSDRMPRGPRASRLTKGRIQTSSADKMTRRKTRRMAGFNVV